MTATQKDQNRSKKLLQTRGCPQMTGPCAPISELVLRNRGAGPLGLLNLLHERCGGVFDDIETVLPSKERTAFMESYKTAAGYAVERLNAAQRTIAEGARVRP